MIIQILIFLASIFVFLIVYRAISINKASTLYNLESKKKAAKSKYEFMLNQKRSLQKEFIEKEKKLTTLYNNQEGIKTISTEDLADDTVDENEKVSRYLIQEGKITMEQNEKVLQKMKILQMDYLGVCMALGIIDLATAQKAIKVNKIRSRNTIA